MNCKPGDLAYIRVSRQSRTPENDGRIVTVKRMAIVGEYFLSLDGVAVRYAPDDEKMSWVVESSSPLAWYGKNNKKTYLVMERPVGDEYLIPIRDNDAEDEMLRLVGIPKTTETQ